MRFKRFLSLLAALCLLAAVLPGETALAAAKYYITVDLTNQIVTVYDNGNISESGIVRQMICSTGKSGTATPTGTYTLPSKAYSYERSEWYYFSKYNCYAKWATRIIGGILFHSVLYTSAKKGPTKSSVNALGSKASHGCVRLRVADAKWIAQNCPAGTSCRIYNSGKTNSSLRKKLLKKSFSRSSETYDHFMGRSSESAQAQSKLSKGSKGEKVTELQKRLKALGFLNDVVDGKFGSNTETAVKNFQAAAGLKKTGKVDEALWNSIFADGAPTGTYVTLSKGMSGPAVAVLQQALIDLKLYDGTADGSFSAEVAQAVMSYQGSFGRAVTGKADRALQEDALSRAESVKRQFAGADYRLVTTEVEAELAKVKGASSVKLRAKASTKGKTVATLKKGVEVEVLSKGGSWSQVSWDGKTGYIQNKYLSFYTGSRTAASYEAGSEEMPAPTATPEIYIPTPTPAPSATPAPWATATATPEIYIPTPTPEVYIPVATSGSDAVVLAAPAEAEVPETELLLTGELPERAEPDEGEAADEAAVAGDETAAGGEAVPGETAVAEGETVSEVENEAVAENGTAPEAAPEPGLPRYALAASEGVALYALPGEGEPVALLAAGEAAEVLELRDGWVALRLGEGVAYAPIGGVELTDELPQVAAPEAIEEPAGILPGTETEPEAAPMEGFDENGLLVEAEPEDETEPEE